MENSELNQLIDLLDNPSALKQKIVELKSSSSLNESTDGFITLYDLYNGDIQKIKDYLSESKIQIIRPLRKKKFVTSYLKYAAIFIAIIGIGSLYFLNSNSVDYYTKYSEKDSGLPVFMSINKNKLDNWMLDYKEGNFELALKEGKKLSEENPKNDTIQYYLGIIQLEVKSPKDALQSFNKIQKKESIYYEKIRFLKCICLLEIDKEKAKNELLKLSKENSLYSKKAMIIIEDVF